MQIQLRLEAGEVEGRVGGGCPHALEAAEFAIGLLVSSLGGADAALHSHEDLTGAMEAFAQGNAVGAVGERGVVLPEMGLGAEEAAQAPFAADEVVDLETLFGRGWLEAVEVLLLQEEEIEAVLAVDELFFGIEAGFEAVYRRHGPARDGARPRIHILEVVGVHLLFGKHLRHRIHWRGTALIPR